MPSVASALALLALVAIGFAGWSYLEYAIHGWLSHTFKTPAATMHRRHHRQELLRVHHLSHHSRNPKAYHGVTTRFRDHLVGTLPTHHREDYARGAHHVPLGGRSNFGTLWPKR